jgi:hypothetical protein
MTLATMKKKVTRLIEEVGTDASQITDDPDILAKLNDVINQIMFELARMKKIPAYVEMEVNENDLITFADIKEETNNDVYQIDMVRGIEYELKAEGTIIKALESGIAEIEYFRYPTRITDDTDDNTYEFELSEDALEIMPYGIAADLLKSDVSNAYGNVYMQRYQQMKQELDPRYNMGSIYIEGGIEV